MNRLYADMSGKQTDNTKQTNATRAVEKLIERDRQSRERSQHIIDYYTNGQQKGMRI
ncbi:MAG: hypothetical protein K2N36_01335 [Ruminiclostridium sp.]|nr:hypothetical protein [Ruminiclostridium sp.]